MVYVYVCMFKDMCKYMSNTWFMYMFNNIVCLSFFDFHKDLEVGNGFSLTPFLAV